MTSLNDNPNADFSDVSSSGSTSAGSSGGSADFSDVMSGGSSTAGGTQTYTVKKGDSLSKIAREFYGDPGKWKKIHAANADKIPNPDLIHPGLQLTIPS